ncbi:MAG: Flp pilus assembly complex ATPase component TadA [Planctomycetes bacterium]|nr:Flp pilus assembly complex ATPase component TadA [Planctomycetota bacterium]
MAKLDKLLALEKTKGALDLFLAVGQRPKLRLAGDVLTLATSPAFTAEELRGALAEICPPARWQELEGRGETRFGYGLDGVGRFRCHYFKQNLGVAAAFRAVPDKIPALADLGMPPQVEGFAALRDGLVLVVGPPTSGRTTTLSALMSVVNNSSRRHALCIEDPIEFMHPVRKAILTQREVGFHTESFRTAMESALAQDVEVLLIGDLPDVGSIGMALDAADRGMLVFAGLAAESAGHALERVAEAFPAPARPRACSLLAEVLRGVVALTLLPAAEGKGRCAAPEVLCAHPSVAAVIRSGKLDGLAAALAAGLGSWYQPIDTALEELLGAGKIQPEDAFRAAQDKSIFSGLVGR